jgi:AraC-like DNA-binding protein
MVSQTLDSSAHQSLQHLGFVRYAPHPFLQSWVQCYWKVTSEDLAVTEEKLYPDGGTSLIIDFAQPALPMRFNAIQTFHRLPLSGRLDRIGIRFHPGGAFQLLGLDMGELAGRELCLQALGFERPLVQEQLSEALSLQQRLQLIDTWLLQESARFKAERGLVQRLLPLMSLGDNSIEDLSNQSALSRRQLERKFQQQVGLSPVKLKQLIRIKQARLLISQSPASSLTQIALDAGFYDQAHFIRQFQQITQQTPGEYRQRKLSQKYNSPI